MTMLHCFRLLRQLSVWEYQLIDGATPRTNLAIFYAPISPIIIYAYKLLPRVALGA